MEATALRIRNEEVAHRGPARGAADRFFPRRLRKVAGVIFVAVTSTIFADIDWPAAKKRLAAENELLARRPQGHDGTYFVICTLYYTPMESGVTAERGFDMTLVTAPGLRGRKYPRDFLAAVKKEGYGKIATAVNGREYIAYDGDGSYRFADTPRGRGITVLVPRSSAAVRGRHPFPTDAKVTLTDKTVLEVFGSSEWTIVDTGGGLNRWQVDLYWGEDEPLGPGKLLARPRGTEFEFSFSEARVKTSNDEPSKD